ncbi:MAG: CoA transferase subunit A [Acidimicrobiales bacterium]
MAVIFKFREDILAALDAVASGSSIAVGGFGSSGRPDTLLNALCDLGRRDLHVIANNVGEDVVTGIGRMVAEKRVRKLTASFPVLDEFYDEYFAGRIDFELVPQGTLAERLRAGGAGIAAFFTPSGAGTMLADGTFTLRYDHAGKPEGQLPLRESRVFAGRPHVLEHGIVADFGLVKAQQGDRKGNLRFHRSARNFNPLVGMSGRRTFAEVERFVEAGEIDPDDVHLAGVFVDDVLQSSSRVSKEMGVQVVPR